MSRLFRLLLMAGTFAAVLGLGPAAYAQDPGDLAERYDRTTALIKDLGAEKLDLERLRGVLEAPSFSEANRDEWKTAVVERQAILGRWMKTREERGQLRPTEDIEASRAAARRALEALVKSEAPVLPADFAEADLATCEQQAEQARARVGRARQVVEERSITLAARETELREIGERENEVRRILEGAGGEAADALAKYRLETARLELRYLAERRTYCEEVRLRGPAVTDLRETEAETARLELERAQKLLGLATDVHRRILARQAREAALRSEQARDEAERAADPLVRFRRTRASERESTDSKRIEEAKLLTEIGRAVSDHELTNTRYRRELDQLKERIAIGGAAAGRAGEVLLLTWQRVTENQLVLRRRTLPDHDAKVERLMSVRADVQDRIWALQLTVGERPPEWEQLVASLPAERHAEARQAYEEETPHLLDALERRRRGLDVLLTKYAELGRTYTERLETLEALYAFVVQRIYWIRSDAPVGVATLAAVPGEVGRLAAAFTGATFRSEVAATFSESPGRFLGAGVVLLVLVIGGGALALRLRRFRTRWSYRGSRLVVFLRRFGVSLLLSALAPACLLLAVAFLAGSGLPDLVVVPGQLILTVMAFVLFARRLLWAFFREEGLATVELGAPRDVAEQLLGVSRRITTLAVVLFLPWLVLSEEPLGLVHLPRILYVVMLLAGAWILIRLLGRQRPFMRSIVGERGFWSRAWLFLHLLLGAGLLGIVTMDVLGYRFGAGLLTKNVVQTFLAVLLLLGAYNFFTRTVDRAAKRLRKRRRSEDETKEERARAEEAVRQLTRFAGVVAVCVAVVLLADFWGALDQVASFFRAVEIAAIDAAAGRYLTLLDIFGALLWIVAGHVLVANLAGIFEVLIFPSLESTDRGSRFVAVTITRYLVLVFVYGAALLSLEISFASLGWILAAASLGIGFGLQEIISNFISGLILLIERPVRVGDIINVGTTAGTVQQINIRATTIENWDRQAMIIPNRKFITEDVINWTRNDDIIRATLDIGVAYGSDTEKVIRILMETVKEHRLVLEEPPIRVLFLNFGESSLNFRVWFFTKIPDRLPTVSDIQERITRRFSEEGITIPFPQRDLWIRNETDPDLAAAVLEPKPPSEDES